MDGHTKCLAFVALAAASFVAVWLPRRARKRKADAGGGAANEDEDVGVHLESSSFVAELVRLRSLPNPTLSPRFGKERMQAAYYADIERLSRLNARIEGRRPRDAGTLRVMSHNIHFWRRGCSGSVGPSNARAVLDLVHRYDPDIVLLQEVIPHGSLSGEDEEEGGGATTSTVLGALAARLGYQHQVLAGSPDAHVLPSDSPETFGEASGQRLHVAIASRLALNESAAVPLGASGHAAFASIVLPHGEAHGKEGSPRRRGAGGDSGKRLVGLMSTHLSVRCPGETRLAEANAMINYAGMWVAGREAQGHGVDVIIAGDFNQPSAADYEALTWEAMAADMEAAGLPRDDGVARRFKGEGYVHSFDEVRAERRPGRDGGHYPPGFSTWNGALVDFMYHQRRPGASLRTMASWVVYTGISDHLPIITDYMCDA